MSTEKQDDLLRELRASVPTMIQAQIILAQVTRAKFDSLIKEGFSEQQALELCKSVTL